MLFQQLFQRGSIVVGKRMGQRLNRARDPRIASRASDIPILPAVIAATSDAIAEGKRPGCSHRAGGNIGTVLAKTDHLRAGNQARQTFGQFYFQRVRQREAMTFCQLARYCGVHSIVRVTKKVGKESLNEIDVLVSVHIPYPTTLAALQEKWRDSLHILCVPLAERLRATGYDLLRTPQPALRFLQRSPGSRSTARFVIKTAQISFVRNNRGIYFLYGRIHIDVLQYIFHAEILGAGESGKDAANKI